MRHGNNNRKFGRESNQRGSLLRSLARNLIRDEKIATTLAKAREIRPFVEKLVTKAKTDTVASRRLVSSRLQGANEVTKLFATVAPKYKSRAGGYVRIIKTANRDHDGSPMALIEFV